jgi:nicotinamide-nucleotide amidase
MIPMEQIVFKIHALLIKKQKTIATAESCTGGILASMLTHFSESSRYFNLGLITYSNNAKTSILKVPATLINKKGAVSAEVAKIMALKTRRMAKTDFAIGITGIAGPTGGTATKPVGTVFIAVAGKTRNILKKFLFRGSRASIRRQAALKALELLKTFL